MALLNKSQFLSKRDFGYKDIEIKGLDGAIRIRALTVIDQLDFEEIAAAKDFNQKELMFKLVLKCCIDDKGDLLFTEDDLPALGEQPADVMVNLFKEILKINSLDQSEVDNIAKN